MNEEGQRIKVRIAERDLAFKVETPEEEANFRCGAKEVNMMLSQYKERYPKNSLSDFLSLIALIMAKKVQELERRINDDPVKGEIEDLTAKITQYLEKDND